MRLTQFVVNNWYLFAALAVVLYLLLAPIARQRLYGIRHLSPAQAIQLINRENGVVLDVCEPNEFATGHIANAVNIPLPHLKERARELEKYRDRPVIVSCRSGNRSLKGALLLHKQGFGKVYSLGGGILVWQRENLPLEK